MGILLLLSEHISIETINECIILFPSYIFMTISYGSVQEYIELTFALLI